MKTSPYLAFPICLIFLGICAACNRTPGPDIDILQIEGVAWACNVSTSYAAFGVESETEESLEVALPVSKGDLLYMMIDLADLQYYYRYNPEDGTRLSVSFDTVNAVSVFLNGNLDYMELSELSSLKAFRDLTDPEVEQLSTIYINGPLSDELLSTLKQHEIVLAGKGLVMEGGKGSKNFNDVLSICQPRLLVLEDSWELPDPEEARLLSNLELLWVDSHIPAFARLAPFCRNLESLILTEWEPAPGELLALSGLKNLKSITIAESDITTLSGIEFPKSLRFMQLVSCDTLSDISQLHELNGLQRLGLTYCDRVEDIELLQEMNSLHWLSFPENTSQQEFSQITDQLPALEVVELIECSEIKDLSPLLRLPDLNTLVLELEDEQLAMIDSLKQLKLAILPSEVFVNNPEWINELRLSLPNTSIVPGSGLCLGSGWLMLLLPLILLFRYLFRQKE